MSTIAVIGAGPGLGAAVARRFGAEGFAVALIARDKSKLDNMAADLSSQGVTARGYAADVRDREALTGALDAAAADLGPIRVLQYSPLPRPEFLKPVLETGVDDLASAFAFSVSGPVAAVQQVLPGMREAGGATILLVNGASAATPNPKVAGTSVAFAGESAYGAMLHEALAPEGVHVGQLIIPGAIRPGNGAFDPDALAQTLWEMHRDRGVFRQVAGEEQ
jgi:short-subunit dehydrogenase